MTHLSKHDSCRFISNLTRHQISSSWELTCQTLHFTCSPTLHMTHQFQLLVVEMQIKSFQEILRLEVERGIG